MKICQKHWDMLRKAIEERGMSHLVAKSGKDVMRHMVTDLEGRDSENDFDPLMACNNMIWSKSLEDFGLEVMRPDNEQCPVCYALIMSERWWIEGPAEAALNEAKEKGLVPK